MNHNNSSQSSFGDNYYDINITRNLASNILNGKKKKMQVMNDPRRVGSLSSIATLDSKRPGDYYVQKMSQSSLNISVLGKGMSGFNTRPISGESIMSLQSNNSDDSLEVSSHFDVQGSVSTSSVSNSIGSTLNSPNGSGYSFSNTTDKFNNKIKYDLNDDTLEEEEAMDSVTEMKSSLSTLALKSNNSSLVSLPPTGNQLPKPSLKSVSTSKLVSSNPPPPKLFTHKSTTSLTRTKSRFLNSKEKKERQQMKKKMYDDNDDDDLILTNDDLVFNVPVLKHHADIYSNRKNSSASLLSRKDLFSPADDSKYRSGASMKPCPLPGNIGSMSSLNESLVNVNNSASNNSFSEEDSFQTMTSDLDLEITQNISNFYSERSASFSKLAMYSREQDVVYKLPKYVKSQSSIEDLTLISQEKLNFVDQTRPINLPPKVLIDKNKHNREFKRVINDYEMSTKLQKEDRIRSFESIFSNQKVWLKLIDTAGQDNYFNKRFNSERNTVRKLAWESNCPREILYEFFLQFLSNEINETTIESIKQSFITSNNKYSNLSDTMKNSKGLEFSISIKSILERPFFRAIFKELNFDYEYNDYQEKFKTLLYIKSLSENGICKNDEKFLIPLFLVLFEDRSLSDIYLLVELANQKIFNEEFLKELSTSFKGWTNLNSSYKMSYSLYKFLKSFSNLDEFEYLNSNALIEVILHINDQLPLSLSAPSTPIISSGFEFTPHNGERPISQDAFSGQTPNYNSSVLNLCLRFLQLLVIYSNSPKTSMKNNLKLSQSFMMVIFQYYHINWNDINELMNLNSSIRLNNSGDQGENLDSFVRKWKDAFKAF